MLILSEMELIKANEFKNAHCGNIHYVVSVTGMGDVIKIVCESCLKERDITDYDSW